MKTMTMDEAFNELVDEIYAETGAMPFVGDVEEGPTLEGLTKNLVEKPEQRNPLTFTVLLPQLSDNPCQLQVMVSGLLRWGKSLTHWKLLGLYFNGLAQLQRVGIHYNADTRKGRIILDPPPWR